MTRSTLITLALALCPVALTHATVVALDGELAVYGDYTSRLRPVISIRGEAGEPIAVVESEVTTRSEDALFRQARGRCVEIHDRRHGTPSTRTCVFTDAAGDQFVSEAAVDGWTLGSYGVKRSRLVGGTGKYRGITGEMAVYPVSLEPPTAIVDGRTTGRMEIRYRLPTSISFIGS
jgi:hypothetical protein